MAPFSPKQIIGFVLFIISIGLPFLFRLDYMVIQPWDESLFAFRAYHLSEFGTPLKTLEPYSNFSGFTNTKPIFMTFWQAVSYRIFGYSEFALRLPIALCSILLCFSFPFISLKRNNELTTGILASFILVCSLGMVYFHMGRSGNQDIPFALFAFLFAYQAYNFIKTHESKHAILAILFFAMAYYTKSIFIFITFPALAVILFSDPNSKQLLKNKILWAGLICLASILVIGNLDSTPHIGNFKRLTTVVEHQQPFYFYLKTLVMKWHFMPWLLFTPIGIKAIWANKFMKYVLLQTICILIAISISQTKLYWYSAPLFPFLALLSAFSLRHWITKLIKNKNIQLATLVLLFIWPYYNVWDWIYQPREYKPSNKVIVVLKEAQKAYPHLKSIALYTAESNVPQVDFYKHIYNKHKGYNYKKTLSLSEKNNHLIAEKADIETHYSRDQYRVLLNYHDCQLIEFLN